MCHYSGGFDAFVRLKASSQGCHSAHSSQPAPLPPAQRPSSLRHAIIEHRLHPVWRAGPCLCLYATLVFEIKKKIRLLLECRCRHHLLSTDKSCRVPRERVNSMRLLTLRANLFKVLSGKNQGKNKQRAYTILNRAQGPFSGIGTTI